MKAAGYMENNGLGGKICKPGVGISVRQMLRKGLDLRENIKDVKAAALCGFNIKVADLSRVHFRKEACRHRWYQAASKYW